MISLISSTGDETTDNLVRGIISIYEAAFPERIRGYYLVGSFGDDTSISSSDIDMEIIFKGAMTHDEVERCQQLKAGCRALSPIHLDLPVIAEAYFHMVDTVAVKLASKFVYGNDTRESIPLPTIENYLRHITIPTQRGLTVRFREETVSLPLDYPLPDDNYYGYMPQRFNDDDAPLKLWVLNIGWLATFLLVKQAGITVPSKRDMLPLYQEHINDAWTAFLEKVYHYGRNQWQYRYPTDEDDIGLLKELCRQTLAFENFVAEQYVDWLRKELVSGDGEMAQERLAAFEME